MDIIYKTNKLKKICTDYSVAVKTYGPDMAEKIHLRINQISAAETVEMMIQFRIGRCHSLKQDREGQFAMDLIHPYRLVFEKEGDIIQIAHIIEIIDYH